MQPMADCPAPYNNARWLALDRVRRALNQSREVAAAASKRNPGDAASMLRSAASFLLQRAAEYDSAKPEACPECGDGDLVNRLAWVDARTHELVEMIDPGDPDATDIDYPFYCGRCCGEVTP